MAGLGTWVAGFAIVLYLALENGGFDLAARSEVGIAAWWLVLVGTGVGALPAAGGSRRGKWLFAALLVFAAWTAASMAWTESAERTAAELARVTAYLGIFVLALSIQGARRWRYLLAGVTSALGVVVAIAVLSRLEPTWFSTSSAGDFFPTSGLERRLSFPLNYSTGLAILAAMALPLLLHHATVARTYLGQGLAAAAFPLAVLALWLTSSSLALPLATLGLLVFLVTATDRLAKLASLLVGLAGGAMLIIAVGQREAVDRGLGTSLAQSQGGELIWLCVIVCAAVALIQVGIDLLARYAKRSSRLSVGPRALAGIVAGFVGVAFLVALAAGVPGELSERWNEFESPSETAAESREGQLLDLSSSGRFTFWESAADAFESEPVLGIGPGAFEFWWAREGQEGGFVRDAHSLVLETFAELGLVGGAILVAFLVAVIAIGMIRTARAPARIRSSIGAATAGAAVFIAGAAIDWSWELGAIAAAFLILAAVAVAGGDDDDPSVERRRASGRRRLVEPGLRWGVVIVGLVAFASLVFPLAAAEQIETSRAAAVNGDLVGALDAARDAEAVQPYAATPLLQQALVLERNREFDLAAELAREATTEEPTNWRTWLILSRLEARRGDPAASVDAFREARSLNPASPVFDQAEASQ